MSKADRYSKCLCKNCGGHIEFPAEGTGQTVACPHCGWPTVLGSDSPSKMASIGGGLETRQRVFGLFAGAAILVLAAGLGLFCYLAKKRPPATEPGAATLMKANQFARKEPPLPPPDPWHGLMAGPVNLKKANEGDLVYATGTISNASDHERFAVKVELDVFDDGNKKVGTATDYAPSIDPARVWKFKALVTDRTAATAKITSVKEK